MTHPYTCQYLGLKWHALKMEAEYYRTLLRNIGAYLQDCTVSCPEDRIMNLHHREKLNFFLRVSCNLQPITVAVQRQEVSSSALAPGSWVRILFETLKSIRISSLFVLCFGGSGLATGEISVPAVCKINDFWINLNGKSQEGLIRQEDE